MTNKERLEKIYKEINHLDGNCNMNDNLEDIEWLLTQVRTLQTRNKKLREALELILRCEPTDKNGEYDLINQNQFWKASKALADEGEE